MEMDLEGPEASLANVYGKKVDDEEVENNAVLTAGEKERLRWPKSEYEDN